MLGLSKLWKALVRLAGAVEGLADTLDGANQSLRQRLGFAGEDEALDYRTASAGELPGPEADAEPARNSRRKTKV